MNKRVFASWSLAAGLVALSTLTGFAVVGDRGAAGSPQQRSPAPLPDGPQILEARAQRIRVVTVTKGLSHPWGLAFLPDGNVLITERAGRLRIVRQGVLDPQPIPGVPTVHTVLVAGLMDIALHPQFAENRLVYLTYSKPGDAAPPQRWHVAASTAWPSPTCTTSSWPRRGPPSSRDCETAATAHASHSPRMARCT